MSLLHTPPNRPNSKSVQLMTTCLCDAFYADVAQATVEVLEFLGCDIELPDGQTCCGQPAFNGGDWANSRKVVRHTAKVFAGDKPIIVPSGSCAAMLFHGAPLEFEKEADLPVIQAPRQSHMGAARLLSSTASASPTGPALSQQKMTVPPQLPPTWLE